MQKSQSKGEVNQELKAVITELTSGEEFVAFAKKLNIDFG